VSIYINLQKAILKFKIMKRTIRTNSAKRDLEKLISKLNVNEILDTRAMSCVRGGDGEGGEDGIIIPPKQQ